ncbi:bucentaur or craniofacial development-domain-containing protein [Xylariales sp. PMI_506]|nr:bucentaur or craniofacial development-domain-containing protein [Xylariales sp. PMI_506]
MATEPLLDDDYASEEDSDFAPDAAPVDGESEASDSDGEAGAGAGAGAAVKSKRKRDVGDNTGDDDGFENSGDEAIISKGKKRQKKKKHQQKDGPPDEDDDAEGGLIKTRSMRAVEKAERKTAIVQGPVTVDVNDLWAKMIAGPAIPSKSSTQKENGDLADGDDERDKSEAVSAGAEAPKPAQEDEKEQRSSMIKIKRTYNFAGKIHTEEKLVLRDSAEAKVYLASLGESAETAAAQEDEEQPTRQPRRAFRSAFEPVLEATLLQRADLNLGMTARLQLREQQAKAKKLNVVEKSRLDWAGFVDKEGIKDELELAGKSKESYTARQDFLSRVDAKREEDARRARIAGRV